MQFGFREMIFTSLSLGMVAGTYAMIVEPHARARQQRLAEIRSMDAAMPGVHNSTDRYQQQRTSAASNFQTQAAIDEVLQTAAANSLQPGEVHLLKSEEVDGIASQPVKLQFTGNFNGFYAFLLQLEQMTRVMRMTQMDLSGIDDHDGQIQAELTLAIYSDVPIADRSHVMDHAQVPLADLRSNPFRPDVSPETFAQDAADTRKSDGDRVVMLQNLEKLQLQSIVKNGDHPECMIDNRLYREGEQIDTFTIEQIEASDVVIRNGGYRFELKIAG